MAKKFVRGITDVKTINKQDFDTNNVNDLLSDGQYNYIHRKKGKNEEYHNLTDNIKTLSSDNTELLSVTNNNKTTNTATLHPKHDSQKEQVLESTRDTISIHHGTNGTAEKTNVDTNPQKVLEHENLQTGDGLTVNHDNNTSTIKIMPTFKPIETTAKDLENGMVYGIGFTDAPTLDFEDTYHYTTIKVADNKNMQIALKESANTPTLMIAHYRFITNGKASGWRRMTIDYKQLLTLLAQKQDTLTAGSGITIQGNTISASGGAPVQGASVSIQDFTPPTYEFSAYKHVVTSGEQTLTTFSFECYEAETVLTGELKKELVNYVYPNDTFSNGAVSISYDGTNMKLINSAPSENVYQHGTFTFGGGGSAS